MGSSESALLEGGTLEELANVLGKPTTLAESLLNAAESAERSTGVLSISELGQQLHHHHQQQQQQQQRQDDEEERCVGTTRRPGGDDHGDAVQQVVHLMKTEQREDDEDDADREQQQQHDECGGVPSSSSISTPSNYSNAASTYTPMSSSTQLATTSSLPAMVRPWKLAEYDHHHQQHQQQHALHQHLLQQHQHHHHHRQEDDQEETQSQENGGQQQQLLGNQGLSGQQDAGGHDVPPGACSERRYKSEPLSVFVPAAGGYGPPPGPGSGAGSGPGPDPGSLGSPDTWFPPLMVNRESHYSLFAPQRSRIAEEFYHPQGAHPFPGLGRNSYEGLMGQPVQGGHGNQKICVICCDEASGCHYGVITCGSCKVFFKRASEGQNNYLCAGRNDCIIDKIRRKNCPACRLRKCCQAGMVLGAHRSKRMRMKTSGGDDAARRGDGGGAGSSTQALVQWDPSVRDGRLTPSSVPSGSNLFGSNVSGLSYSPSILSILQLIEPEVVYAGFDNSRPMTANYLLTSLNRLCERQLVPVVKWAKVLPGFKELHIDDQMTLIQYSWMGLMAFAMGWRSYKLANGQMLYFAPDLIFNEQRMQQSAMYELCLGMQQVFKQFGLLQVTQEEFLCMKAIMLLNTVPQEGLKTQAFFNEMRMNYIRELNKVVISKNNTADGWKRFYQLTKMLDSMHDLVGGMLQFCFHTFVQSQTLSVEFPEMMSEMINAQLPRVLAGMAKPLLFHGQDAQWMPPTRNPMHHRSLS
ncbi:mineralocorticoid receptor-like [Lethenteron reissneri]|uniref:mineralocorticoid receptor-like n=1 Tax=Lethenteron reissneri TaxID=7753 RepID=UPI002AB6E975|nr:mineralocorticoid receptor-like [Lethenteron reissneri]